MKIRYFVFGLLFLFTLSLGAQEIHLTKTASLEQVYGDIQESETLLPMNDLGVEFGYVLYQAEITIESEEAILELENVRDYAAVYVDKKYQGSITDNQKKIVLNMTDGTYLLQLYTENIGRITYGPEILDNSKGLFGSITLDDEEIENWIMIPLNVRNVDVNNLQFTDDGDNMIPCFHRGYFEVSESKNNTYLDISGWGMGEVWINGNYMGSYWEEEKQQSIQISLKNLVKGKNEIVIFELKNNGQKTVKLSDKPVFK